MGNDQPGVLLVVGGNDMPRRVAGAGRAQTGFIRLRERGIVLDRFSLDDLKSNADVPSAKANNSQAKELPVLSNQPSQIDAAGFPFRLDFHVRFDESSPPRRALWLLIVLHDLVQTEANQILMVESRAGR